MDILFRSVVGKLWLTIIALFAVVLTSISLLFVQWFDSSYIDKQGEELENLATRLSDIIKASPEQEQIIMETGSVVEAYGTGILFVDGQLNPIAGSLTHHLLPAGTVSQLLVHPDLALSEVVKGSERKPVLLVFSDHPSERSQVLALARPIPLQDGGKGAVVLYQVIQDINGTGDVRKILYIVGVAAFLLTTVFAFFLSTRITLPLRQMKQTASRIAEGDFHAEIPIITQDEIGELAAAFNTMASRLNESVHALSHEKEQLASVLRSMGDGVIMINSEGKIVVTNPPAEEFLRDCEFERTGDEHPFFRLYQKVADDKQPLNEDLPVQGRIWSIVMTPLHVNETMRGVVAVLRDMTKERKMDKLRKDFVANVSHELRTPLSMLQGYSEAIVDGIAATPEEHVELAKIIYDESVRMSKLVNELLDLARMEAGHVELHIKDVPIRPYFARIQRKFSNLAREKSINLQLELVTDRETVRFDEDRMEQVLTNLIDNALRHTPRLGTVKVKVSGNHPLVIEVSDTGSGIPQEDLPFVFERFYKADKARTRGLAGGTGLGLAIARNIVEAHGGTISVQSKVGEGTTFSIKLYDEYLTK